MRPTKESVEPTSNITNGQIMTKEPAPVSALDKLDAGLRSLDHCKLFHHSHTSGFDLKSRQEQVAVMALLSSTEVDPLGALGDAVFSYDAKENALSSPRLLLLNHRQSWHTHLLHGFSADTVLVWIYKFWQRVCPWRAALITFPDQCEEWSIFWLQEFSLADS